jgi:2-polyprenyl-3-methyl-5-hydroxy-6-metoxy-1,4-benzoquinol methylase
MRRAAVILGELAARELDRPKILDSGCGTGWMTEILAQFGEAHGADLAIGPALERHPQLTFHDVAAVPHAAFDVVVSQEVIEHADDQGAYVDALHSCLRVGGVLLLTTPNAPVSTRHPRLLVQPNERHLTRTELRRLLGERFQVLKLYSFFYGYARWRPYRVQVRLGKLLNAGLHLIAVCRKDSAPSSLVR